MSEVTKPATASPVAPKSAKAPKAAPAKKTNPKCAGALSFVDTSNAVLADIDRKKLVFDRRLQHRSKLTDETTVGEYAEVDKENADAGKPSVFPALKAVHQTTDEDGKPCDLYWVYDGFQRGAAFERNGRKKVAVQLIPGTFEDAFVLSLSSNATNSILPRNRDDKSRSVRALLDSEPALELVRKRAKSFGGMMRALAIACGVSVGTVDNVLIDRGIKVSGDKFVKRTTSRKATNSAADKGDDKPAPELAKGPAAPAAAPKPVDPEAQKKVNDASYEVMRQRAYVDRVGECQTIVKRLGVLFSTLVTDSANKAEVRQVMAAHKMDIAKEFDARSGAKDFTPYYEILEHWAPVAKLGAMILELKRIGAEKKDAAADAVKAAEAAAK